MKNLSLEAALHKILAAIEKGREQFKHQCPLKAKNSKVINDCKMFNFLHNIKFVVY